MTSPEQVCTPGEPRHATPSIGSSQVGTKGFLLQQVSPPVGLVLAALAASYPYLFFAWPMFPKHALSGQLMPLGTSGDAGSTFHTASTLSYSSAGTLAQVGV